MLVVAHAGAAAVAATPNECCRVSKASQQQQQHKDHHQQQPAQLQMDAVSTQQQPLLTPTSSKLQQMGVIQYADAAPAGPSAAASGAAALEPSANNSSGSFTGRSERRPSRSERRPSRSERRASAAAVAAAVAGYSTDSYWNSRYAERSTHFDWFYNYSALADLVNVTCDSQAGPCLHVGCGNSGFSEGMTLDGFEVVNVDISPVVIEQMRVMDQAPGQTWEVADCRAMPQYGDASFGSVLDKGTLDAVLCSSHGIADSAAYIDEVYRLLKPGGVFLLVSLGQPQARLAALKAGQAPPPLPYLSAELLQRSAAGSPAAAAAGGLAAAGLASTAAGAAANGGGGSESGRSGGSARDGGQQQQWQWESVEVYLLPKPSLYMQSEASLTGKPIVATTRHSDKDLPVEWLGPLQPGPQLDSFVGQQHLDMREFFTAFACRKPAEAEAAAAASSVAAP